MGIEAVNTRFETKNGTSSEWHYYIFGRNMSVYEILSRSRKEWCVESMHWLPEVHFSEDFCRVMEQRTQKNLNIVRRIILNSLRNYKNQNNGKSAFSHLMIECMIELDNILKFGGLFFKTKFPWYNFIMC